MAQRTTLSILSLPKEKNIRPKENDKKFKQVLKYKIQIPIYTKT